MKTSGMMFNPAALLVAGLGAQTESKQFKMNCPMNLQGTTVSVSDTKSGIAVSLPAKPENVTELRKRVEQLVAMSSASGTSPAMMQGQMMPATVKQESIKNGAKSTRLRPKYQTRLSELRQQVRAHIEKSAEAPQCSC
jgi:transcriptional regulator with AAA-type ATPase domain